MYKDAFQEFRQEFESIVTATGSTVEQTLSMFGDPTMANMIFDKSSEGQAHELKTRFSRLSLSFHSLFMLPCLLGTVTSNLDVLRPPLLALKGHVFEIVRAGIIDILSSDLDQSATVLDLLFASDSAASLCQTSYVINVSRSVG